MKADRLPQSSKTQAWEKGGPHVRRVDFIGKLSGINDPCHVAVLRTFEKGVIEQTAPSVEGLLAGNCLTICCDLSHGVKALVAADERTICYLFKLIKCGFSFLPDAVLIRVALVIIYHVQIP